MFKVIGTHPKCLATYAANIGLLAGVQCRMNLQISGCLKGFLTNFAGEFALAVNVLPVAVHAARTAKSFATIRASVRELTRMLPHVNF